jgi:hypothetical protein
MVNKNLDNFLAAEFIDEEKLKRKTILISISTLTFLKLQKEVKHSTQSVSGYIEERLFEHWKNQSENKNTDGKKEEKNSEETKE